MIHIILRSSLRKVIKMKKINRVFLFIPTFAVIFCIFSSQVFAAFESSPYFDSLLEMQENYYYSPHSNLESISLPLVVNDVERFYSFSSPYSVSAINIRDGYDTLDHLTYDYAIGTYLDQYSRPQPLNCHSSLIYDYCNAGPYCRYIVGFLEPFIWQTSETKQFRLHYGQSALPLSSVDSGIDPALNQPYWPSYKFEVYNTLFGDEYVYFKVSIHAVLLSFEYDYVDYPSSFAFTEAPHMLGYNYSTVFRMNADTFDEGMYLLDFSLYDLIADSVSEYMVDSTNRQIESEYVIFDSIDVTFDVSYDDEFLNRSLDGSLYYNNVYLIDYFFDREDSPLLGYPPNFTSAFKFFSETYPVYELPQSFDDLDFTDFITSVLSIFSIALIGEFTLAQLLFGVAGIGLLMWFLKMFAGG